MTSIPHFPLIRTGATARSQLSKLIQNALPASHKKQSKTTGFNIGLVQPINKRLHRLLKDMAMFTEIADAYYFQTSHEIPDAITTLLMKARSEIQHELLCGSTSQLDKQAFSATERSSDTLSRIEAVRLAASMYSDMVLWPLAYSTGVKPRLAARLQMVIEASKLDDATDPISQPSISTPDKLCVWVLWSGCLAALNSAHQGWFEVRLRGKLESIYGVNGFAELDLERVRTGILEGFLYWEPIYERPNRELWARINCSS
jgi:hypothetical protein